MIVEEIEIGVVVEGGTVTMTIDIVLVEGDTTVKMTIEEGMKMIEIVEGDTTVTTTTIEEDTGTIPTTTTDLTNHREEGGTNIVGIQQMIGGIPIDTNHIPGTTADNGNYKHPEVRSNTTVRSWT